MKLTHKNLLISAFEMAKLTRDLGVVTGDPVISYLPYPHSFEQLVLGIELMRGLRIGYY